MKWATPKRIRIAVVSVAIAALFLTASPVQADLYWSSVGTSSIDTAELDGTGAAVLVPSAGSNLNQVTVGSNGYIYWADYDQNAIGRAKLDGSDAEPLWLTGAAGAAGVAVSATHIYWSEDGNNRVSRAQIDGSNIESDLVVGLNGPHGLVIVNDDLYIANTASDAIVRAPLDGGQFEVLANVTGPQMLAANATHLYWTNFRGESVGRAAIDGSGVDEQFIIASSGSWTYGVGVDSEHIYWTNYTGASSVSRANLDGTNIDDSFIPGTSYAAGLAVVPAPSIGSVTPATGPVAGGTRLSVQGTGFFEAAEVTVGGQTCSNLEWIATTQVNCTTPAGVLGPSSVTISNPDSQSATAVDAFTFVKDDPQPTKQTQNPTNSCAKAPAVVPVRGKVRLLKAHCQTTAGEPVSVRVSARARQAASRGDLTYYRVIRKPNGRTILKTYGHPVKLKVTWKASATDNYNPYKKVRTYRTL